MNYLSVKTQEECDRERWEYALNPSYTNVRFEHKELYDQILANAKTIQSLQSQIADLKKEISNLKST